MNLKVKLPHTPLKPLLPQQEQGTAAQDRQKQLAVRRSEYRLSSSNPMGIPLLVDIPERESFSSRYTAERGAASEPVTQNESAVNATASAPFAPLGGLAEFEELYPKLPAPDVMASWLGDYSFGEQRLSGLNPGMIRKVSNEAGLRHVDVAGLKAGLGGGEIKYPLYMIDYSQDLAGVGGGRIPIPPGGEGTRKFCPKPIGLFRWVDKPQDEGLTFVTRGLFLPVAIQVDLKEGSRVFTPKSPSLLWTIAKICFSIADANVHEMSTHLGRTHFALESFGVVTPRQLAPQHPVFILLEPHLKFLVWNNQQGVERLVQPDGPVDLLLAGTRQESLDIAIKAAKNWSIAEDFEDDLKSRGVADTHELPHYPFRDDGLLVWNAIRDYVENYLDLYYKDDKAVEDDNEAQAWVRELASPADDGGRIKDMPAKVAGRAELGKLLTKIIFSLSAGHSAINFPQYPYLGFIPNAPLAGYADYQSFLAAPPPTYAGQLDWLTQFLPPHFAAMGQIAITASLSVYHYDKLGDYANDLADPEARHELYKFVQRLHTIERIIEARNLRRLVPYRFLLPSEILNGASI